MANQNNKGIKRIYHALGYSINGFKATYQHEEAFRQELWLITASMIAAFWLCQEIWQIAILWLSACLILIIEIINSAIEAVVDRIGSEQHELSGRAKDMGSAAVTIAIIAHVVLWVFILAGRFAH